MRRESPKPQTIAKKSYSTEQHTISDLQYVHHLPRGSFPYETQNSSHQASDPRLQDNTEPSYDYWMEGEYMVLWDSNLFSSQVDMADIFCDPALWDTSPNVAGNEDQSTAYHEHF